MGERKVNGPSLDSFLYLIFWSNNAMRRERKKEREKNNYREVTAERNPFV